MQYCVRKLYTLKKENCKNLRSIKTHHQLFILSLTRPFSFSRLVWNDEDGLRRSERNEVKENIKERHKEANEWANFHRSYIGRKRKRFSFFSFFSFAFTENPCLGSWKLVSIDQEKRSIRSCKLWKEKFLVFYNFLWKDAADAASTDDDEEFSRMSNSKIFFSLSFFL